MQMHHGTYLHISNVRLTFLDERTILFVPFFFAFLQHTSASITWFVWCMSSQAWHPEAWALSSQCLLLFWIQYLHNTISWCTSSAPYMQRLSLMAVSRICSVYVFDSLHHNQQLVSRAVKSSLWYLQCWITFMFFTYTCKIVPKWHMIVCFCLHYLHTSF